MLSKRFLERVDKNGPVPRHAPRLGRCWMWKAEKCPKGYGLFRKFGKRDRTARVAHRVSYQDRYGKIPKGKVLDHLCRVTSCVRPTHLEAVTNRVNVLRGFGPSSINARKTRCINGHRLAGKNLYVGRGTYGKQRACKICKIESQRRIARRVVLSSRCHGDRSA